MSALDLLQKIPASILGQSPAGNMGKLWRLFAEQVDELESSIADVDELHKFSQITGYNLDKLGTLLLQNREGRTDDSYRLFLQIAIQKRNSPGDLFTLNAIAAQLLGDAGEIEEIRERCYDPDPLLFDGTWALNNTIPLNGKKKLPATFEIIYRGNVDTLNVFPEFNKAVDQIRAGGVRSIINYKFEINTAQTLLYPITRLKMDASWKMTGSKDMSGENPDAEPFYIAVGDGVYTEEPDGSETSLMNELMRRPVLNGNLGDGKAGHLIRVRQSELVGKNISEIGLFTENNDMIALDTFPAKPKDSHIEYEFIIEEKL